MVYSHLFFFKFRGRRRKISTGTKDNKSKHQKQHQGLNHNMVSPLKFQKHNYFQSRIQSPDKLVQICQSKIENNINYFLNLIFHAAFKPRKRKSQDSEHKRKNTHTKKKRQRKWVMARDDSKMTAVQQSQESANPNGSRSGCSRKDVWEKRK